MPWQRRCLIGFGLENFDAAGRYRTLQYWKKDSGGVPALVAPNEPGAQRCTIEGKGDVDGKPFSGPGGLADLVLESPALNECALLQLYRFGAARHRVCAPARGPQGQLKEKP